MAARLRARRPVHRGARAVSDRHRRPRRHRAAGHHPARAPGRAHQLRPHLRVLINQPAIAPLGEASRIPQIFRELAAAMGFDEPCLPIADETLARAARRRGLLLRRRFRVKLPRLSCCLRRWLSDARRRAQADAPAWACGPCAPNHECGRARAGAGGATRWRAIAAGAPPANSTFVNVKSLRAIEAEPARRDPCRTMPRRWCGDRCAGGGVTAAATVCTADQSEHHPGVVVGLGVWWRKFGVQGTNVNELTHQRSPTSAARRRSTIAWWRSAPAA